MGYAVVHLEKAKGSDSGMSAHIERTVDPKNADKERTHLNKELIDFPDGVENRTQAIQHRLDNAGLTRKIGTNQVRAIRVLLTGSHEDMARIVSEGKFDKWCNDNIDWLRQTYGSNNLVSAVLHLDEKTPHIHATIIPIVTTERKRRKREEAVKKKYKQKAISPRLCTDEVMSRLKLKEYQNTYAEAMQNYGLERGIEGSTAKHVSTSKYYRDLIEQSENIQQDIASLLELKEREQAELSKIRAEKNTEKLKNSVANVGVKVADGIGAILGTPKFAKAELEKRQMQATIDSLSANVAEFGIAILTERKAHKAQQSQSLQTYNSNIATLKEQHSQEIQELTSNHQKETSWYRNEIIRRGRDSATEIEELKSNHTNEMNSMQRTLNSYKYALSKIFVWFPMAKELLRVEELCKKIGLSIEQAAAVLRAEVVTFTGYLFSKEHDKKFQTIGSRIHLFLDSKEKRADLIVDNKHIGDWFKEKNQTVTEAQKVKHEVENPAPEPQQRRGRRM